MKKLTTLALATLIALAPLSFGHAAETPTLTSASKTLTATELVCVRTAVATREAGVRAAYVTLSTALLALMDARAKSLDTAWNLTDSTARKTAREAAWSVWKTSSKTARDAFKVSRKSAWNTFQMSRKACKVSQSEVESAAAQVQDVQ